jgi:glycosyltransferase involved in cell wall biosynthesis
MKEARIILIGGVPPPYHGVTQYTYNLLHSAVDEAFEVWHLDTSDHRSVDNLSRLDPINVILALKNLARLVVLLLKSKPHLVYLPVSVTPLPYLRDGLFILCTALFSKAKVVVHLHGGRFFREEFYGKANTLIRVFIRWTMRNTHSAIVLGESLTSVFHGLARHTAVVPNGSTFRPTRQREAVKRSNSSLQVGYLGNLFEAKGILDVLEAARTVVKHHPSVTFAFAGAWWNQEPQTKEKAISFVERNGLRQRVSFLGVIFDQAKEQFLFETDIFVFPSWNEGLPLVILEAMAAGCPVISTRDVGAIPDVVKDGITGMLVEKKNPDQIAAAICRLVESPDLRERMGKAGKERYEKYYTMERNINQMIAVFRSVLQSSS